MPEMGIAGAGLASTLAEVAALIVFSVYMFFDKFLKPYRLLKIPKFEWGLIKNSLRIASPIVAQAVVGLGSWFFFFGIIENMGERELAVSNLVRVVYLILSIPCWGYSVGVNTLVSNFIGQGQSDQVISIIKKNNDYLSGEHFFIAVPILLFPQYVLYPLFRVRRHEPFCGGSANFLHLFVILSLFAHWRDLFQWHGGDWCDL